MYTIAGKLIDAVALFIIFVSTTSVEGFIFAFGVHGLLESPRSFWSISARGWVIDEDSHSMAGRRRESLFTGVSAAVGKLSAPLAAAVVAGQAIAGIDTTEHVASPSGVFYIRSVYMLMIPLLDILQAVVIYRFPIKGARLQALERAQTKSWQSNAGGAAAED